MIPEQQGKQVSFLEFQLFGNSEQFKKRQEAIQLLHDLQQLLEL